MPARPTFDDVRQWYREEKTRREATEARIAALTALARELAVGVHRQALHQPNWRDCPHAPCVAYRRVIEEQDRQWLAHGREEE